MNLRSAHLANKGARLCGRPIISSPASVPAGPAWEPASQAPSYEGSRATIPDTAGRDVPVAGSETFELTLTPNVQATLLLAARAADVSPAEFVARAIVAHALEAVGFPDLSDELYAPPDERAGASRFHGSGGP